MTVARYSVIELSVTNLAKTPTLQRFKDQNMSQNLIEFLKVLTIVVSFSGLLIAGRHYMLSLDEEEVEEVDEVLGYQEKEF